MLSQGNPILLTDAINTGLINELHYDFRLLNSYHPELKVLVFETDVETDQYIDLYDIYVEEDIAGMIFNGHLHVHNAIIDYELDTYSAFLLVKGNLTCDNLVAGCTEILVKGNANVLHTFIGYYNHGEVHIEGDLHAGLWIEDDHHTSVSGQVNAVTFCRSWHIATPDFSNWHDILLPEAATELIKDDYLFAGSTDLIHKIKEGQPVFKQGLLHTRLTLDDFYRLHQNSLYPPDMDKLTMVEDKWVVSFTRAGHLPGEQEHDSIFIMNHRADLSFFLLKENDLMICLYDDGDNEWKDIVRDSPQERELRRYFSRAQEIVSSRETWNAQYKTAINKEQLWHLIWMLNPTDDLEAFKPKATAIFNRVILAAEYPYAYIHNTYQDDSEKRGLADGPNFSVPIALLDGLLSQGLLAEIPTHRPLANEIAALNQLGTLYWNTTFQYPESYASTPIDTEYLQFVNDQLQQYEMGIIRLNSGIDNYILACIPLRELTAITEKLLLFQIRTDYLI